MKKVLSLMLVLVMVLSATLALASCGDEKEPEVVFEPAASYTDTDTYQEYVISKVIEATVSSTGSGNTVGTDVYAGISGKDYTDANVYTYNDYSDLSASLDWNPHTWETNEDSVILDYISMGFYSFALNSDKTGYSVICEMASALPEDITADYVGQYGVEAGETGKVWKIALNQDAKWENGDIINADSYIYSMKEQLNPYMLNRRADSFYAGDFVLYKAKDYLYQKSDPFDYRLISDLATAVADGLDLYLDMDFWGLIGALDAEGNECAQYVSINDETLYRDTAVEDETEAEAWVSAKYLVDTYLNTGCPYSAYAPYYIYEKYEVVREAVDFSEVGIFKIDDYTIGLALVSPVEEASFYMPYNLASNWLVNETLYESCKTYLNGQDEVAKEDVAADFSNITAIQTDYCKSVENTLSYGPYKLDSYQDGKEYKLVRNDTWYGYSDGKHLGQYQMDNYVMTHVAEHTTAIEMFINGQIDGVGLVAADLETYGSSDRLMYVPQTYTTKITFATDYQALLALNDGETYANAQILAVKDFRKAFSLAIDRAYFASSFTSGSIPEYGLLNKLYCYNPFDGAIYRDSDAAKEAILALYGISYGDGEDYETLEEAYDAITGYSLTDAKALMNSAYDKAVAAQIYDGTSEIKLNFKTYSSDETYVKMFTYLNECIQKAAEGTKFEGKVSLTMTADPDYYDSINAGEATMIFSTWGGAAMSPFGILSNCYTDGGDGSGNQNEYGYYTENIPVTMTIKVDGEEKVIKASLQDWANYCNGAQDGTIVDAIGVFATYDYATRCAIYANLEYVYLNGYACTPIYARNNASLNSYKLDYATDDYLQLIGNGGIQFATFNYDDTEWEAVKATFSYK